MCQKIETAAAVIVEGIREAENREIYKLQFFSHSIAETGISAEDMVRNLRNIGWLDVRISPYQPSGASSNMVDIEGRPPIPRKTPVVEG